MTSDTIALQWTGYKTVSITNDTEQEMFSPIVNSVLAIILYI